MKELYKTLEMLLQNTSDEKAKNDLSQIFGEYYQQFPEKYSKKFDGFIEQNNKFKNKQNNSNSKDDEQSENLPKISLPNIQKITEMLETSLILPMLATDLMNCLHSSDDNEVDTKQLAKFIAQEQPVVIRVLRIANSPFYGLSRQVDSLETAIVVLGIRTIRTLVLNVTVVASLKPPTCELFDCEAFWQHSLAVAVASRLIARLYGGSSELAFTAGLLHDIGRLALAGCFQQEYNHVLKYKQAHNCTLLDAENLILNLTHQQIGKILAKNWRLPKSLEAVISFHHLPTLLQTKLQEKQNISDKLKTELLEFCDIVHLANIFTTLMKLPTNQKNEFVNILAVDGKSWERFTSKVKIEKILDLLPKIEQDFEEISQALLG